MNKEIWALLGLTPAQAMDIVKRIAEVKTLYNVSEAEMKIIEEQAMFLKMTYNLSPELQLKCLRTLVALTETIMDATKHLQKKGNKD